MKWDPNRTVPEEISRKAVDLGRWMEMNDATSVCGIGPVFPLQRRIAELEDDKKTVHAGLRKAHEAIGTFQRQLAQARQQRDTALAALGQVQAAAAELMAAADALLRERDNYRAACAAAAALCNKGSGS